MSWMDSWSRPGKHAPVPPPLYLTQASTVKYCHTCGRVMSDRKSHTKSESTPTPAKYCSARCRSKKPGPVDRKIEDAFVALLSGQREFDGADVCDEVLRGLAGRKGKKGDQRVVVRCSEAGLLVFGSRKDPSKCFGRKKDRASRVIGGGAAAHGGGEAGEWKSVDMLSDDDDDEESGSFGRVETSDIRNGIAGKVRPPQNMTDINGAIGGEKGWAERSGETEEDATKRKQGAMIAEETERVKRAARRGCVFGFQVSEEMNGAGKGKKGEDDGSGGGKRLCEAVMSGAVVEPSFAKGDWGIRWRE